MKCISLNLCAHSFAFTPSISQHHISFHNVSKLLKRRFGLILLKCMPTTHSLEVIKSDAIANYGQTYDFMPEEWTKRDCQFARLLNAARRVGYIRARRSVSHDFVAENRRSEIRHARWTLWSLIDLVEIHFFRRFKSAKNNICRAERLFWPPSAYAV